MLLDCEIACEQKLAQKEIYLIEDEDRAYTRENECEGREKESGCIRLLVSVVHALVCARVDAHVEARARVGAGEGESVGIIEKKADKKPKQNQNQKEEEEVAKDDTSLPTEPAEQGGPKVFP